MSSAGNIRTALLVGGLLAGALCAPARGQEATSAPQTLAARLRVHPIIQNVVRGAQPDPSDYAILRNQHGVTRAIALLTQDAVGDAARKAAADAGIEYVFMPITAAGDDQRIDRSAVREVVDLLKTSAGGVTYIHDDNGKDRTGVVEFAYRVLVGQANYAAAMHAVLKRGFNASRLTGYQEDMKLLASGLDALPELQIMPISDVDLFGRGRRVALQGVRLNVKTMGEGPPVYVLHGGPGESHITLRPYLDGLAERNTLVYFDQRGCGYSTRPQFREAYAIDRLVEDLEQLRQELGHEKISLLAQSSGGAIAVRYALAHRAHVDKLVIVTSWASAEEIQPSEILGLLLMAQEDQEALNKVLMRLRKQGRDFNDEELSEMQKLFYPSQFFGRMTAEFRNDWSRRARLSAMVYNAMSGEYFVKQGQEHKFDLRGDLPQLQGTPTLVIAGKYDIVTPPPVVKTFANRIPGARFEVLDRSGHYPFVEENKRFIRLVREFLAE
jgi:proline iminopeptidase